MPKNKKPAGGRAAKNFEPRYGEKKTSFHDRTGRPGTPDARGSKPGARSAGHRGYSAAAEGASFAPLATKPAARSGFKSNTVTSNPARNKQPAQAAPRLPRPIYP